MNSFVNAMGARANESSENGAFAYKSTNSDIVNLFRTYWCFA